MSTLHIRSGQPSKVAPAQLGAFGSHKTALLEKANPGIRRSTPDSEALASSDDELDHPRQLISSVNASQPIKPVRRTSWLNEIPSASTRKAPIQLSATYSPNNSLPATPSGDLAGWPQPSASPKMNTSTGWGTGASSSFPWNSPGIWNENRKDPPARLQEVLSSSATTNGSNSTLLTSDLQSPLKNRAPLTDNAIPFSIPLHPTPKTYRSQSYSVGQLDPETLNSSLSRSSGNAGRGRGSGPPANLQHRRSRPSVLGDLGHDSGTLGRVREVDDDDENENSSESSQPYTTSQARTIEQLTRENALLRQAAGGQYENRFRDRTGSSISAISATSGFSNPTAPLRNNRMRNNDAESGDLAVEDQEEMGVALEHGSRSAFGRLGEQISNSIDRQQLSVAQIESRNAESSKRAQWQTSLGFGSIPEIPQSRRHSFADVPTRQGSISSAGKSPLQFAMDIPRTKPTDRDEGYGTYGEDTQDSLGEHRECTQLSPRTLEEQHLEFEHLRLRQFAASYFSGPDLNRAPQPSSTLHHAYVSPNTYGRAHQLDHPTQPLFIVTFKCCRSDVFYIQEGTGLQVKPGDLVIVEADRGTDLGTVAHADISWEDARQLKEHYAEEHYKWLMLFSRQSQTGGPNAVNPNGLGANGAPGSAVGGMGPPGAHGPQDAQSGELKPKLIKRLAQNHEIQTLRDKEGNEAKAKRVCQQKVVEHRLNMEILDAEFQM
jgi:PSP1 C-terminal conserved region